MHRPVTTTTAPWPAAIPPCVICGKARSAFEAKRGHICSDLRCKWRYDATPPSERCRGCGRPLTFRQTAQGICDAAACAKSVIIEPQQARERAVRQRLQESAERWRDAELARRGLEGVACEAVIVPAKVARLRPVSARRLQRLVERVRILADWAMKENATEDAAAAAHEGVGGAAPVPPTEPSSGDASPIETDGVSVAGACAACQGSCCRSGAEHAYLYVKNLQQWLRAHPGSGIDEAVEAYVARVGTRTVARSCIYHGPQGCTLPRTMRSQICNEHLCNDLHDWKATHRDGAPARAFFVAVAGTSIERAAYAEGALVQLVRSRPADVERVVVVR